MNPKKHDPNKKIWGYGSDKTAGPDPKIGQVRFFNPDKVPISRVCAHTWLRGKVYTEKKGRAEEKTYQHLSGALVGMFNQKFA